jgi:hypothetical protein
MIDPANVDQVREALLAYVRGRLGPETSFAEAPAALGRGFDTYIYAFRLSESAGLDAAWTQPLVLRVYPSIEQAQKADREAAIQRFTASLAIRLWLRSRSSPPNPRSDYR